MPKPSQENPTNTALLEHRKQIMHEIGVGELRQIEVISRYISLKKQIGIGLNREGEPTMDDGGLLAVRTGIPAISPTAWSEVPSGSKAYVADIAGTNWKVMRASKNSDGEVDLTHISTDAYHDEKRKVTFDEFVGRIAYPIAAEIIANAEQDELTDIGISLGFPHVNRLSSDGIDAHLINVEPDGSMAKEWRITDWEPEKHVNITQAVSTKLGELGIKVRTLVAINDTPAVALDGGAVQAAAARGLDVIPAGFVGGTGTNGALDNNGLVNLEIGHARWPNDKIFERIKENGWTKTVESKLELETGMYLPLRLAAGIQLMHEKDDSFPLDTELIKELTSTDPDKDQTLISRVATGEIECASEIQQLAQRVLKRAGQVYGIMLATIAETAPPPTQTLKHDTPRAILAEGGTILKAFGVKNAAETMTANLNQPVKIIEATGLKGAGALAMAYLHTTR